MCPGSGQSSTPLWAWWWADSGIAADSTQPLHLTLTYWQCLWIYPLCHKVTCLHFWYPFPLGSLLSPQLLYSHNVSRFICINSLLNNCSVSFVYDDRQRSDDCYSGVWMNRHDHSGGGTTTDWLTTASGYSTKYCRTYLWPIHVHQGVSSQSVVLSRSYPPPTRSLTPGHCTGSHSHRDSRGAEYV